MTTQPSGASATRTRYAVSCPVHGQVYLTKAEYDRQMNLADDRWACPRCGRTAEFDDDNYDP